MKLLKIGAAVAVVFLWGCGGDSGNSNDTGDESPQTTSLMCEHDGDLWLCDEQNSCIRDQSTEEVVVEEETEDGLARRVGVKLDNTTITIIAECGSQVSFNNEEEVVTTTVTTTSNIGVNEAQ